jgi:hypothetical protein
MDGTAVFIREVPEEMVWPGAPAPALFRCSPPLPERDDSGQLIAEHEYVLGATRGQISFEGRHFQQAEAMLFAAGEDGKRTGTNAKAIARYSQAGWNPQVWVLLAIHGYEIKEG